MENSLSRLRRSRTGTTLTSEELRGRVIADLVRIELDAVRHRDIEFVRGVARVRVVDNIPDDQVATTAIGDVDGCRTLPVRRSSALWSAAMPPSNGGAGRGANL